MSNEDNFIKVCPSNAQPKEFLNNTASSFSTRLHNAKSLSGPWEVAVKALSFVNTVQTFKNEKLTLEKLEDVPIKDRLRMESMEDHNRIVSYDLSQHSDEWLLAIRPDYSPVRKREIILERFLSVFNSVLTHYYYWAYVKSDRRIFGRVSIEEKTARYALFVSQHVVEITKFKHQLLVPWYTLPFGNVVSILQNGRANDVSEYINFNTVKDFDKDKPLSVTVLPLHRMEQKTIVLTENENINKFVDEFNKKIRQYGLIAAMTTKRVKRKKKKDDDDEGKQKKDDDKGK